MRSCDSHVSYTQGLHCVNLPHLLPSVQQFCAGSIPDCYRAAQNGICFSDCRPVEKRKKGEKKGREREKKKRERGGRQVGSKGKEGRRGGRDRGKGGREEREEGGRERRKGRQSERED